MKKRQEADPDENELAEQDYQSFVLRDVLDHAAGTWSDFRAGYRAGAEAARRSRGRGLQRRPYCARGPTALRRQKTGQRMAAAGAARCNG